MRACVKISLLNSLIPEEKGRESVILISNFLFFLFFTAHYIYIYITQITGERWKMESSEPQNLEGRLSQQTSSSNEEAAQQNHRRGGWTTFPFIIGLYLHLAHTRMRTQTRIMLIYTVRQ